MHSNLPGKLILSQNLKNGRLPLWENKIGQGYPTLAEGIIGTFYLPNLLIFTALPFKFATSAIYLVAFLTSAIGTYYLARKVKANPAQSIIASLAYTFCASVILHVQHINFIQSASLLPLILFSILHFYEKPSIARGIFVSFLFSQLIFTGFIQIAAYATVIFFVFTVIHYALVLKKNFLAISLSYTLIIIFALSLSAVQLIPSFELIKFSDRAAGVESSKILDAFPLFPRNFLTYLNPFILGSAANGTYNSTDWSRYGIFWENTAYIGLLPAILAQASIILLVVKRPKNIFASLALTLAITILLSLGRASPLHILFSFPPLNYFRVPARFILFTQLFASLITIYFLKNLNIKKPAMKILTSALIALTFADLYLNWANYNPVMETDKLMKSPKSAESLKEKNDFRIYSIAAPKNWNEIFIKSGWQGKEDYYVFFVNALDQNSNILYNTSQLAMFETLPTRRYQLQQSIIKNNINIAGDKIIIENLAKNLLDTLNVKYLITSIPIENSYSQIAQVKKADFSYFVYESQEARPKVNFYYDFKVASSVGDYIKTFKDLDFQKTLVLEKTPDLNLEQGKNSARILKDQNGYLKLNVETENDGILALSQTYYPGWQAKVDGQKTEIYAANINSQAIVVKKGQHTVEFIFDPESFKIGLATSLISWGFLLIIGAKKLIKDR